MNITSTHLKIFRCLEHQAYSLTDLTSILGLSQAILRKNLEQLEYFFKINTILKSHNIIKNNSNFFTKLKNEQSFLPDERKICIFLNFLHNNIVNLAKLSKDLEVTRRTLVYDLKILKEELKPFNLSINSAHSLGIQLIGKEVDKRKAFLIYILKIWNDESYLPKILQKNLKNIKKIKSPLSIANIIKNIIKTFEIPSSGLIIRYIEVLTCVSLIRKNITDDSLNNFNMNITGEKNFSLEENLKKISFYTHFEILTILEIVSLRNYKTLIYTQQKYLKKINDILENINLNFKTNLILEKDLVIKLYGILRSHYFKKSFNIKEFYIYNKNLPTNQLLIFEKIKKIILTNFKNIDSFDLIIISSIFLNLLNENRIEIENSKKIAVVYNFLNPLILKDLCKTLNIDSLAGSSEFIYINHLNEYIKKNPSNKFLVFEEIDLSKYKIETLKLSLPIFHKDELTSNEKKFLYNSV